MAELRDVTPLLAVTDMADARRFFQDVLGFSCTYQGDDLSYLRRDGAAIRLYQADEGANMADPARNSGIYIDVDDVDGVFAEMSPALAIPPEPDCRPPFDQPYGQREFHVYYHNIQTIFGAPVSNAETS